jgi:flagellar hook-associated protein 1 FlgK
VSGLFSTFSVAKRGMIVQQKSIDVTSHNIANANTDGYSRQRAKIETTRPFGMPSINSVAEPGQLGTGAQIAAIERVRDSFLDYQVRVETSTQGQYSARDKFLSEVESIFNEPSDTGISTLIGKFYDSWQQLSKQPQSSNARTVVAQQSAALADELNHTYNQLDKLKINTQSTINHTVFEVNNMLNQIDALNQQIVQVKVAGNMPNDLMDKRDLLLDELSSKFNINIDKKNLEGLDIKALDIDGIAQPNFINAIIDGSEKRLSYINSLEKASSTFPTDVTVTYYKLGDMASENNKVTIKLTGVTEAQFKEMDQCRVLWTNNEGTAVDGNGIPIADGATVSYDKLKMFQPSDGELKGYMSVQKDVDDYMNQLNSLAKAIAFTVNAVHSGKENFADDTLPFFVNGNAPSKESEITAGNISVNSEILKDVMKINVGKDADSGETDGSRALAIAQLRDALIKVQDINITIISRADLFDSAKGGNKLQNNGMEIVSNINGMKVDNYFKDTIDRLGVQAQEAKRMVINQESLLNSFEESRLSVSGVSLDEEMANLVQFQHAYNANAKMIATIDELLEVVVNGLKR